MIRKGQPAIYRDADASYVAPDGDAAPTVEPGLVYVLEVDECCQIALVRNISDPFLGDRDYSCDEGLVPLEHLETVEHLEPKPVTYERGRRRPPGYVAPRQDPARKVAAQRRLTEGADKLVECVECEELVAELEDHVCNGETPAAAARSGSATFLVAHDNREGHRCLKARYQ